MTPPADDAPADVLRMGADPTSWALSVVREDIRQMRSEQREDMRLVRAEMVSKREHEAAERAHANEHNAIRGEIAAVVAERDAARAESHRVPRWFRITGTVFGIVGVVCTAILGSLALLSA